MARPRKKILCIDFDGVLHSYASGWTGPRDIPDPPVSGAIPWLRYLLEHGVFDFEVHIFSSRSRYWGARRAMKKWLLRCGLHPNLVARIRFPTRKPPAHLTIDDRAVQFTGRFPGLSEMCDFRPYREGIQ